MDDLKQQFADAIVQWATALPLPVGRTRVNRRLIFGNVETARAVDKALRMRSNARCAWVVRSSSDVDAVRLRNDRPDWVDSNAALIYIVFWLPGSDGHEANFESLRDIPSVTRSDFLARSAEFVLAGEAAVRDQVLEATEAWPEKLRDRAQEHLVAAWDALRKCLRECGSERSLPYIDDVIEYLAWLSVARIPDAEWQSIPAGERARSAVRRWGNALPKLGMFKLPALASVAGICVDPTIPIPPHSRTGEKKWAALFDEILSENRAVATDFPGLEDDIAGNQTLRERLDDLSKRVPLCEDPATRDAARQALERFCQSGDSAALDNVEWLFLKDSSDRGSASQGLRGLLIARKLKSPQVNPLDRLAGDTIALFEALGGEEVRNSGIARQHVSDLRGRAAVNRADALIIAESLRSLAGGILPPGATDADRLLFLKLLSSVDRDPADLEKLARAWERHGRPDADAPIVADSLLLGLLRLSHARFIQGAKTDHMQTMRAVGDGVSELDLSVQVEGRRASLRFPATDWSLERRTSIHEWLRDKVRPLYFESDSVSDEDEENSTSITVDVACVVNEKAHPFGAIDLTIRNRTAALLAASRSPTLSSMHSATTASPSRIIDELFVSSTASSRAEDPDDDALREAWTAWFRACGAGDGWAKVAIVAPLPRAARVWVEEWTRALVEISVTSTSQTELAEILERIPKLAQAGALKEMQRLAARMGELQREVLPTRFVSVNGVRKLLSLCTGILSKDGSARHLVLTPHHPLVLRLRLVGEDLLAEALQRLWTSGWDRETLDDLEGALDDWGLPEPIHCYGAWDGDPLVFDAWADEGFALFSRLGIGREIDSVTLGATRVASEIRKYGDLFPALADRLQLRLLADNRGQWAWRVLEEALRSARFTADVQIVTDLAARQPLHLDLIAQREAMFSNVLEPGSDGAPPRLRIRRSDPAHPRKDPVHISAVVGDLVEQLRSSITLQVAPSQTAQYDVFDRRVFFYEPVPELHDYSFVVSDPPDRLSLAVARAVALAASHPAEVFCERYSFDESRCLFPLQSLQRGAHWLILASRQPLYRAIQQCRTSTLLDFHSGVERGRPFHICVGLDSDRASQAADRLRGLVGSLVKHTLSNDEARGVLDAARALAPGLAIRCVGSSGSIELSGLLGLLLSARATRDALDQGLLIALDQHRDLLTGAGQLSDLLTIGLLDGAVRVGVVEAKFSTATLRPDSAPIQEASRQVLSTVQRLTQFTLDHPLILRTRARLARTIIQRIHLGAPAPDRSPNWSALLKAILDPSVPIVVRAAPIAVHAWSIASDTAAAIQAVPCGGEVHIHDRIETIAALRQLTAL